MDFIEQMSRATEAYTGEYEMNAALESYDRAVLTLDQLALEADLEEQEQPAKQQPGSGNNRLAVFLAGVKKTLLDLGKRFIAFVGKLVQRLKTHIRGLLHVRGSKIDVTPEFSASYMSILTCLRTATAATETSAAVLEKWSQITFTGNLGSIIQKASEFLRDKAEEGQVKATRAALDQAARLNIFATEDGAEKYLESIKKKGVGKLISFDVAKAANTLNGLTATWEKIQKTAQDANRSNQSLSNAGNGAANNARGYQQAVRTSTSLQTEVLRCCQSAFNIIGILDRYQVNAGKSMGFRGEGVVREAQRNRQGIQPQNKMEDSAFDKMGNHLKGMKDRLHNRNQNKEPSEQ